jgi:glycosyltransferase involved in cell wall biosynthesis
MQKVNILFINHEKDFLSGSSYSLLNLIKSVKNDVHPIILLQKDSVCIDFFLSHNIDCIVVPFKLDIIGKCSIIKRIFSFPFRFIRDFFHNKTAIKQVVKLLINHNISIVHSNSSVVDIGPSIAAQLNAKHIWHLREYQNLDFEMNPFLGWSRLKKKIFDSDAVIAISKGIFDHFKYSEALQYYHIPNAVRSVNDAFINDQKKKKFLICGMITATKGQEFAIKCFNKFVVNYPDYRLKIIGSGDKKYIDYLKSIAHSNVDFEGYQSETAEYYKIATAYLMCSRNEGLGRTTIEAMFYGCPVIGFNSGGTSEIINHNSNGLLYNEMEQCISYMNHIVANPDFALAIAKQAQLDAIQNYSEEVYGKKIIEIYKSLL